jgi:hypothetical protein
MDTLSRIAQFIVLCIAVLIVLVAFNWMSVSRFKIEKDLRDYARAIRQSNLMLHEKERLLDQVERLEDRPRSGEQISWRIWCLHNQTIWEMLDDGIEGDEARLVERELERTEEDFQFVEPSDDEARGKR